MVDDLRPTVQTLLRSLPTQKLTALKQLFWSELNYDRAGATLSMAGWPAAMQGMVAEAPQIFATAGEGDGFQVIYCRLSGTDQGRVQPLSLGDERTLVGRLLREHPYALFVFSNTAQDHWHFVNVKYEQDAEARARRVFRRISVGPYETAGPEQRLRTATERLSLLDIAMLAPALLGVSPLVIQNRHDEAFDVEAVTRDFFATYRTIFEQVEKLITGLAGEEERLFTQRLFNRLLFLIFLERKGWLTFDGRSDYLRALWEAHRGAVEAGDDDNFYRDRLRLLFFSGLNTPNEVDVVGANRHGFLQQRIGHAPYLNGGLFEEDAGDRNPNVVVSDRAIDLILTRLLYHYNFTITESTPLDVEVAVDPEMLGKIFEELVTGRHESGSYYTPKPVVAFMGQEALKGYLESACAGEERAALAAFVERRDPAALHRPDGVLDALRQVTICDPACGSGAYLLGMMHELMDLRGALAARATVDHQTLYEQKLEIIQRNLYGVDIDPFAVNIARLRLWLSLIVEYEGETPPPLPNLDFKIETGDSLTAPSPASLEPDMFRDQQVREYFELKSRFLQAHGGQKVELRRQIDALREQMRAWAHTSGRVDGFDWVVEFAEVFDGPDGLGLTVSGAMAQIVNTTAGQMELAGEAAKHGGFDVILANPPYVRQELLGGEYKAQLKAIYPEVYAGAADLYVYFYARALQLARPGGMVVFISSNKFMRAGYGEKLRKHLGAATTLRAVIDYGDLPLFTATAYPCIVATRKQAPEPKSRFQTVVIDDIHEVENTSSVVTQRASDRPQSSLHANGWILGQLQIVSLMTKLKDAGPPLGEYVKGAIHYGIKTGLNEAFVVDRTTRDRLIEEHESSQLLLKPYLRGRDIKKWNVQATDLWLIFTRRGTDISQYPAIERHLEQFKERLLPKPSGWPKSKPWKGRNIVDPAVKTADHG
ncbi:DNA methyltransferase, partial [Caldilinea sp.]|uniref:Eco57I restriction-modification methylase domain-containing protein n=1 Tax=Caldilinea sp. TaxID=2293560 RepID=UPI002B6E0C93|nr:Eco57I restriction-modification methylase domain-containing protein [Caldilinea sp.]